MKNSEDTIGSIPCPWCKRPAEVHEFTRRTKLDPAGGEGRESYPSKFFVVCPPVTGYRGCGTTLAASREAQGKLLEHAKIFGAGGAAAPAAPAPAPAPPPPPPPPPPAPAKKKSAFELW